MIRINCYRILVLLFVMFLLNMGTLKSIAQDTNKGKGHIQIVQDEKVDLLVSKHIQINQSRKGIEGYRTTQKQMRSLSMRGLKRNIRI